MKSPAAILSMDSYGGLIVGVLTLALYSFLTGFYNWSLDFLLFVGVANLVYGCYSGILLWRFRRTGVVPLAGVIILVIFNSIWAGHCLTQIWYQWETWTFFGINHLALEAAYVSFLAFVECRYVLLRD